MRSLFFQELVDAGCGSATFTHGENHGCGTQHDVTTGVDLLHESLVGSCIFEKDVTLLVDGEFRRGVADKRVAPVTDSNEHGVAFDFEACAFDLDRTRTALFIGFAQLVLVDEHAAHVAGFVAKNLGRVLQNAEFNTLFLGMANLPRTLALGLLNTAAFLLCLIYIVPVCFLPSLAALIGSPFIEPMFKPFMPAEAENE